MLDQESVPDEPRVVLPAILDLPAAATIKQQLEVALNEAAEVHIDASAVQRVTTPCLQVLISAFKTVAEAGESSLSIRNSSAVFMEAVTTLALAPALGLVGSAE